MFELEQIGLELSAYDEKLEEMGASLWQGKPRKEISRTWTSNAGKRILGWYKKGRRSY